MAARKKATKATKKKATKGSADNRSKQLDATTVKAIVDTAQDVHQEIGKHRKPDLSFPIRSLGNVSYSQKRGYFEIGKQRKTRTLTVNTVKSFAQTLRMMGLSKELIESADFATKRDAYYQSKNWGDARIPGANRIRYGHGRHRSDVLYVQGESREQLRFIS